MPYELVAGVPIAYFDMKVSLELAERCGYIVGVRTGFMDLAAVFNKCMIQAIYPDDSHPAWDCYKNVIWDKTVHSDFTQKYMESVGLEKIYDRRNVYEFTYTNDEEVIDRIIKNIGE